MRRWAPSRSRGPTSSFGYLVLVTDTETSEGCKGSPRERQAEAAKARHLGRYVGDGDPRELVLEGLARGRG